MSSTTMPCLLETWRNSELELFRWLLKNSQSEALAMDVLQETFLRALKQQQQFCDISDQRAWLYRVASNLLNDEWRRQNRISTLPDNYQELASFSSDNVLLEPVDGLAQCLPKALARLNPQERSIIESCDIKGMNQQAFAQAHQLSLPATKSRLQRARKKLKQHLSTHCSVRFDEQNKVCCYTPRKCD